MTNLKSILAVFLFLVLTACATTIGQEVLTQSIANAGELQFFVLEGAWTPERARHELWRSQGSESLNQLELPKGQYLLGISRKTDQQDAAFVDRTYSYPGPFFKGTDQEVISKKNVVGIPVDFNPTSATATYTVKDGIICWNWQQGIIIVPRLGQKGVLAHLLGVDKDNRDPLMPPLEKGDEDELQLVIVEEKPVELRKVFIIESQQKIQCQDTLRSYSKLKPF